MACFQSFAMTKGTQKICCIFVYLQSQICQKIPRSNSWVKGYKRTNLNRFCQMPSKMSMHKLHSYQQHMRFPPIQLLSTLENYTLCYFKMTSSKTFFTGHLNSNQDPTQITLIHLYFFLTLLNASEEKIK